MIPPPETLLPASVPCARPISRGFLQPCQSALRALVEIVIVFGVFGVWIVVILLAHVGCWPFSLIPTPSVYVEVLSNGLLILVVVMIISKIAKTGFAGLGLHLSKMGVNFGIGLLASVPCYGIIACISLLLAALTIMTGAETAESLLEAKEPIFEAVSSISLLMVLPMALFIGLYEEILFRGFLLGRLVSLTRSLTVAVIFSSVLFGVLHYASQGWLGLVQTTCMGFVMAVLTVWRKSLWSAIACHAAVDTIGILAALVLVPWLEQFTQQGVPQVTG